MNIDKAESTATDVISYNM